MISPPLRGGLLHHAFADCKCDAKLLIQFLFPVKEKSKFCNYFDFYHFLQEYQDQNTERFLLINYLR